MYMSDVMQANGGGRLPRAGVLLPPANNMTLPTQQPTAPLSPQGPMPAPPFGGGQQVGIGGNMPASPGMLSSPTNDAGGNQQVGIGPRLPTSPMSSPGLPPGTPPNTNYSGGTYGSVNGINPVAVSPTSLTGMQPFINAAYDQSTSRLDPQFAQLQERFDQDMVNRGIQPGTAAYDKAYANFGRTRNDAYASANNNAMGQGLAAQGQAWGQGAQQAGLAQAMMGYGLNRDQFDMNSLLGLTGLQQNSAAQNFNMGQSLLGMTPNTAPTQIDTYSPYQIQQGGINASNANAASQNNGTGAAVGTIAAAAITAF